MSQGQYIQYPANGGTGSGGGVLSINTLTGNVNLVAGSNITLTPAGQNITIASTASGGGSSSSTLTVGTIDGASANSNGATIGSNSLFMQSATASFPGVVSTSSQNFRGQKSFTDPVIFLTSPELFALSPSAPLRTNASQFITVGSLSLTNDVNGILPVVFGGTSVGTVLPFSVLSNNTANPNVWTSNQSLVLGGQDVVDIAVAMQATSSASTYYQNIIQNSSNGSQSSTDYIVNNNLGTSSSNYVDLGMNSSTFIGAGSLQKANAGYLYVNSGDLVIGTQQPNTVHFLANNSSQDALQINTVNQLVVPQFSGIGIVVNSASGILSSVPLLPQSLGGATGSNTGDLSIVAFGTTPNANGGSIAAGQVLTLQPASVTLPGGISAVAQTFGGAKSFATSVQSPSIIVGSLTFTQSAGGGTYPLIYPANQGAGGQALTNSSGTGILSWSAVLTNPMTGVGDLIVGSSTGTAVRFPGSTSNSVSYLASQATAGSTNFPTWNVFRPPTVQKFLAIGSASYTVPTGAFYIVVEMVGGGGGGGGSGTSGTVVGATGSSSIFGTSLLVANGGLGGNALAGGAGGNASLGSGPIGLSLVGGSGTGAGTSLATFDINGGPGGASAFGGTGAGATAAGGAGVASTGGGGGGAGAITTLNANGGGGGGSGGFVRAYISGAVMGSAGGVFAITVGAGGSGGAAGVSGSAGGAGGSGLVVITEYYQ